MCPQLEKWLIKTKNITLTSMDKAELRKCHHLQLPDSEAELFFEDMTLLYDLKIM